MNIKSMMRIVGSPSASAPGCSAWRTGIAPDSNSLSFARPAPPTGGHPAPARGLDEGERAAVSRALALAVNAVRQHQSSDGSFRAPLGTDPSFTAYHILLTHFLGQVDPAREARMVAYLKGTQRASGGWSGYPGGPDSLDITLLAYAALKLSGLDTNDAGIVRARSVIKRLGGVSAANIWIRVPLVFLGQLPFRAIPTVTPKLVSIPSWFHPNIYDLPIVRSVLVPIALLYKWKISRPPPTRTRHRGACSPVPAGVDPC